MTHTSQAALFSQQSSTRLSAPLSAASSTVATIFHQLYLTPNPRQQRALILLAPELLYVCGSQQTWLQAWLLQVPHSCSDPAVDPVREHFRRSEGYLRGQVEIKTLHIVQLFIAFMG